MQGKGRDRDLIFKRIDDAHKRLAKATIEHLPYEDFVRGYDRPSTLFYLDPPYWGRETLYGKGLFERADFERMADLLRGIKGRFILSLNDLPEVRETFSGFESTPVKIRYTVRRGSLPHADELLITGPKRRRS